MLSRWVETLSSLLAEADTITPTLWVVSSAVGGVLLSGGLMLLAVRVRRWSRARVEGEIVALSEDFGPALVGVWHPTIVLPRWILSLGARERSLAVRHEVEHREARDTLLLTLGTLGTVLVPWNPAVWFMARRLRQAIELDCDRRVLDAGFEVAEYGGLLIELSAGSTRPGLFAAAMTQPTSLLERRLKMMTKQKRSPSPYGALAGLLLAVAVLAAACDTPPPSMTAPDAALATAEATPSAPPAAETAVLTPVSMGDPLIYVDGVRIESGELGLIDPDDVARVEVVKGEAARGLFGDEAADGVVQIFLKQGSDEDGMTVRIRGPVGPEAGEPTGAKGTPEGAVRLREMGPDQDGMPVKIFVDGEPAPSLDGIHPEDIERMDVIGAEDGDEVYVTLKPARSSGGA